MTAMATHDLIASAVWGGGLVGVASRSVQALVDV